MCNIFDTFFKKDDKKKEKSERELRRNYIDFEYVKSGKIFRNLNFIKMIEKMYEEIVKNDKDSYSMQYLFSQYIDVDKNKEIDENGKKCTIFDLCDSVENLLKNIFIHLKCIDLEYTDKSALSLQFNIANNYNIITDPITYEIVENDIKNLLYIDNDTNYKFKKNIINHGTIIINSNVDMKNINLDNYGVIIIYEKFDINTLTNNGFILNQGQINANNVVNNSIMYTNGFVKNNNITNSNLIINIYSIISEGILENTDIGKILNYGSLLVDNIKYSDESIENHDYGTIRYTKK